MGTASKIRAPRILSVSFFLAVMCLSLMGPTVEEASARGHFGFRGGFRGGFGRSFKGGRSFNRGFGFKNRRFGSFRRFGFRGFRGFGRSRFNSLAFRSRRFGFGGFNRFKPINNFGFGFGRNRFNTFKPAHRTFAFNHFPVSRVHSGFGTFHHPATFVANRYTSCPNHFTSVRLPSHFVSGSGWNHLASGRTVDASSAFANDIHAGSSPGVARVGFALASAEGGDLDKGVWAMRRAFETNKDAVASLMMDDSMTELVARVTRLYEDRMEDKGTNSEDAFMLASLYQMQGDPEMAMMAIDYAVAVNDNKVSTTNLTQLIESEMATIPMNNSVAWEQLAAGNHDQAAVTFIGEIGKDETAGAPKLGYALAIAGGGNLEQGTWALRRAFKIDPEGTSDVMLSGKLRPIVENITEKYVSDAENNGINKDNSYALATLFMLQGDIEAAEMIANNSPDVEHTYVASMIDDEMKTQVAMMDEAMEKMEDSHEDDYDEFITAVDGLGTEELSVDGSGTKDSTSDGSGTKELFSQGPVIEELPPPGSGTRNTVEAGSGTREPSSGSGSKEIVPLEGPDSIPIEGSSGPIETLQGSGSKAIESSGSGTKVPATGGSSTKF